jgi:hypothetical protein
MVNDAGDQLAQLLLPYRRFGLEDADGRDHRTGWWFADAPPDVAHQAFTLIQATPGIRPNDQPPEEWMVAHAGHRDGTLAGFVAPGDPDGPRMRVDAIIVPCPQAADLAADIARLWPVDNGCTALDLAVVEGLASSDANRVLWSVPGSEFLAWCADSDDLLGAAFCSFWWD